MSLARGVVDSGVFTPIVLNAVSQEQSAIIIISGTYGGVAVSFQGSLDDGTTWFAIGAARMDNGGLESSRVLSANETASWVLPVMDIPKIRVNPTAWTSGSASVVIFGSTEPAPFFGSSAAGDVSAIATDVSAIATDMNTVAAWDESGRAKVNPIVGQAGIEAGAGAVTVKTVRTAISTDANRIVQGGLIKPISVTKTRPADTNAYAAKDVINESTTAGTVWTFASAARANGLSGDVIGAILLTDQGTNTASYRLHLYTVAPTAINDNSPNAHV